MVSNDTDLATKFLQLDQGRAHTSRRGLSLHGRTALAYFNRMAGGIIEIS